MIPPPSGALDSENSLSVLTTPHMLQNSPRASLPHPGILLAMLAVLGLTALGGALTWRQVRQIENANREAALESARERVTPALLAHLDRLEREALEALRQLAFESPGDRLDRLTRLEDSGALIAAPVLFGPGARLLYPALPPGETAGGPELPGIAPDDFLQARRYLHAGAPSARVVEALEAVQEQEHLESVWRWQALGLLGGHHLREGRPAEASEAYRRLFERFDDELRREDPSSHLDYSRAHAGALEESGQPGRARRVLVRALEHLLAHPQPGSDLEGEILFSRTLSSLPVEEKATDSTPAGSSFATLVRRHRLRLTHHELAARLGEMARERLLAGDSGGGLVESGRERLDARGGPYLFSWRSSGSLFVRLDPGGIHAVGFFWNPDRLHEAIREHLEARERGGYRFLLSSAGSPDGEATATELPSLTLPHPLDHLRLVTDSTSWRRRLQELKRPLRIAQVLIPALGLGMLLALYLLHRSFARLRAISRLKTDFVANVSHELKTPLALIRMFGETLQLGRIQNEGKKSEYYQIITRESERLTHLINNVLDFASIEAGKKSYELLDTDLARVARDTLQAYRFQLDQKGFRVKLEVPDSPVRALADPDAVSQALINLINNAIKYSRERRDLLLRVEVRPEAGEIAILVRDRGVGIPRNDQKYIFDSFFRSQGSATTGGRGTGLGLAVVHHILEAHGGRVELESQIGEGSTFTLIFPVPGETSRPENPETERHE